MILNDFRKKLITTINESNLSIDCIYFVFKDVLSEITENYNMIAKKEQEEANKQEEQKIENNDEEEENNG